MKRVGIKGKTVKTIAVFGLAAFAMGASGRDLLWTAYNARTWDLGDTRQNWHDLAYTGTVRTYFQNGDNVLFDGDVLRSGGRDCCPPRAGTAADDRHDGG